MNTDLKNTDDDQKLTELADFAKGLSHPHRLKIIEILAKLPAQNQCMVSSIVEQLPIAQSTVSQHLKILRDTGWIEGRIDGPRVCYCIKEEVFAKYRAELEQLFKMT